jgi:hypothetical protein
MAEDSPEASVARDWLSAPSAWALDWRPHPTPMATPTVMGTPTVMLVTPTTVAAAILSQGELGPRGAGVFTGSRCVTEVFPQGAPPIQRGHRWIAFCANSKPR